MRHQSGRSVDLQHRFVTDDETVLTPASVAVTVTREGRTDPEVQGPATPVGDAWAFAAGALPEGAYSVLWDGGATARDTALLEVVGGVLVTVADVRADPELPADRWDAATVVDARERVSAEFERITGRAFVPRTRTVPVTVADGCPVWLPFRDVLSVEVRDDTGTVVPDVTSESVGPLTTVSGLDSGTYAVDVRFGFGAVPDDIRGAALLRIRSLLFAGASGIPDRATSFQPAEGGTYRLATAGMRGSETGIPDVDAVLARYRLSVLDDVVGVAF